AVKLPMRARRTKATSCLVSRTSFNHESSSCMQSKQTNARIGPEMNSGTRAACRTRVKTNSSLKRRGSPSGGSADWQSAVSPNGIRQSVEHFEGAEDFRQVRMENPRCRRLKICATTCPPGLSRRQFLGKTAQGVTVGA